MIRENIHRILAELPEGVQLMAAVKGRTPEEVSEAVRAGVHLIGENYVQEALSHQTHTAGKTPFHFIGHLQRNKAGQAVRLFDMIETVDSLRLAAEIDARCKSARRTMDILLEINSGRESQKFGVLPEDAPGLARGVVAMASLRLRGLMTMGPYTGDPEEARPYFIETRKVFEEIRALAIPGVDMAVLSMGMTNSYRVALEEGATIVRIGTAIFGPREP